VAKGSHHQVSAIVGVSIHEHRAGGAAKKNQVFPIGVFGKHSTKKASGLFFTTNVLNSPWCPEGASDSGFLCVAHE